MADPNVIGQPATVNAPYDPYLMSLDVTRARHLPGILDDIRAQIKRSQRSAGPVGIQPQISAGPVWTPEQVQGQVNASQASIDRSTGTQQRQAAQSAAGRGFTGRSPLLAALQSQIGQQGMAQRTESARQIPWEAAQGNAKQLLASQTAAEQQYANRQSEAIERGKQMNYLIQALAGLV